MCTELIVQWTVGFVYNQRSPSNPPPLLGLQKRLRFHIGFIRTYFHPLYAVYWRHLQVWGDEMIFDSSNHKSHNSNREHLWRAFFSLFRFPCFFSCDGRKKQRPAAEIDDQLHSSCLRLMNASWDWVPHSWTSSRKAQVVISKNKNNCD